MKIQEIRELSTTELRSRSRLLKEEAFHLRIKQQSGQLEKPSQIRSIRRQVAKLETVLAQKAQVSCIVN